MNMIDFDAARAAYDSDGVVCMRSLVPKHQVDMILRTVEAFKQAPAGRYKDVRDPGGGRFFMAFYLSHHDEALRSFAIKGPLVAAAKALTGAKTMRFFYDQLFAKDPGSSTATPWHHDQPYWPINGNQTISMWVALSPISARSGYLEYVGGSHRWGRMFRPSRPGTGAETAIAGDGMEAAPDMDDPVLRAGQRMLRWDMEPGDVLCHHPLVVHGTVAGAISEDPRYGISLRYMGDDARWRPNPFSMAVPGAPDFTVGSYPGDDRVFPPAG